MYTMYRMYTEENRNRYESMKNKVKKSVSKALRGNAEDVLSELKDFLCGMS